MPISFKDALRYMAWLCWGGALVGFAVFAWTLVTRCYVLPGSSLLEIRIFCDKASEAARGNTAVWIAIALFVAGALLQQGSQRRKRPPLR